MPDVTVVFDGLQMVIDEAFFDLDMVDELNVTAIFDGPTEQDIIGSLELI